MKHHKKYMKTYGPTMQCNNEKFDYVKCSKCSSPAITYALSLNHHLSIAWSMTVGMSVRRHLSLSISRIEYWHTHFFVL